MRGFDNEAQNIVARQNDGREALFKNLNITSVHTLDLYM